MSTKGPNAHNQVSIQLDYTGNIQNIYSQHFPPYKCIGPIQMHGEANMTLPSKVNADHHFSNVVDLQLTMTCAKIRPKGFFGSGEEDF